MPTERHGGWPQSRQLISRTEAWTRASLVRRERSNLARHKREAAMEVAREVMAALKGESNDPV